MSNLEHLIENGLSVLKRGVSYEKWLKTMKDDVNWQGNENISIEQLWTICQYVIYTWIPSAQPERKKGKWVGKEQFANSPEYYSWQCSVCGCVLEDPTLDKQYPFCPHCGSQNAEEEGGEE